MKELLMGLAFGLLLGAWGMHNANSSETNELKTIIAYKNLQDQECRGIITWYKVGDEWAGDCHQVIRRQKPKEGPKPLSAIELANLSPGAGAGCGCVKGEGVPGAITGHYCPQGYIEHHEGCFCNHLASDATSCDMSKIPWMPYAADGTAPCDTGCNVTVTPQPTPAIGSGWVCVCLD